MVSRYWYHVLIVALIGLNVWQYFKSEDRNISKLNTAYAKGWKQKNDFSFEDKEQLLDTIANLRAELVAQQQSQKESKYSAEVNKKAIANSLKNSDALHMRATSLLQSQYGPMLHLLANELSNQDIELLKEVLFQGITQQIINGENANSESIERLLQSMLDEQAYALYQGFKEHGKETSSFIQTLDHALSNASESKLNLEQTQALMVLFVEAKSDGLSDIYGSLQNALEVEALQMGMAIEEFVNSEVSYEVRQTIIKNRILDQASSILTSAQLYQLSEQPEWDYLSENAQVF